MGNALNTFDFNSNTIRVIEIDGQPWFTAKDVAAILGYANTTVMVSQLDAQDRAKKFIAPGTQANIISEAGLYQIIMRAQRKNPVARSFQDWVTRVVLPAIRKDGGYIAGEEKVATGEMAEDELMARAVLMAQRKIERLITERDAYKAEFDNVTIASYVAINKVYLTRSEKGFLASRATQVARDRKINLPKEPRKVVTNSGKVIYTTINVYPRSLLDELVVLYGMLEPREIAA